MQNYLNATKICEMFCLLLHILQSAHVVLESTVMFWAITSSLYLISGYNTVSVIAAKNATRSVLQRLANNQASFPCWSVLQWGLDVLCKFIHGIIKW